MDGQFAIDERLLRQWLAGEYVLSRGIDDADLLEQVQDLIEEFWSLVEDEYDGAAQRLPSAPERRWIIQHAIDYLGGRA